MGISIRKPQSEIRNALSRRALLQSAVAVGLGASLPGWLVRLANCAEHAATAKAKGKHCILLWMDGGPSHIDTFDPKPDAEAGVRGAFEAIDTAVPGIQVTERFPKLAASMKHLALIRGMSTVEADHGRARVYMHTGYRPGQGGVTYPGLGSIISSELGKSDFPLPNFVATGTPLGKYEFLTDAGYLGPRHGGLSHPYANQKLENLEPLAESEKFRRRQRLLTEIEDEFAGAYKALNAESHRAVLERAFRLMSAEDARAFDISLEPARSREAYGDHSFGQGCLLARRLVEVGVPFVEVYLGNWDTHEKRVVDEATALMPVVDRGMATLISDLEDRGLLNDTLVVWMGEFGRTPRVNKGGGRDHYSKAWSAVLAGCGVRGGQVVGKTDGMGASVVDRPVSAPDLMATICRALGIDHTRKMDTPVGRPVHLVDAAGKPIEEVFSG